MPLESDHDRLIRNDAMLTSIGVEVKENARQSITRDAELRAQLDRVLESCNAMQQGISEIKQTQRTDEADRVQLWERVNILWGERTPVEARQNILRQHMQMWEQHTPDQNKRREQHEQQHESMWSAFTIAKFCVALFVIEQPVIIGIVVTILARQ